jgi:hypothetical protein
MQGTADSPGYYQYGHFDSETYANLSVSENLNLKWRTYDTMIDSTYFFPKDCSVRWGHTVAFIYQ